MLDRAEQLAEFKAQRRAGLTELGARCQKLGHREIGSWMARRVARPLALRVTWVISPWGISAHTMTLAAWGVGFAAALAFCLGDRWSWLLGAGLWQLWYLLDHVDGQLARLYRTESLDGAQLDYWMHHAIHLSIPCGLGYGLFVCGGEPAWLFVGFFWGMALLIVGLEPDTRAKSFILRLKRLRGELRVVGGGGGRPAPSTRPLRHRLGLAKWMVRKALETHVLMNVITLLTLVQFAMGDSSLFSARVFVAVMSPLAVVAAGSVVAHSVRRESAEREFSAWFRLPPDTELAYHDGWWVVDRRQTGKPDQLGKKLPPASPRSS